MAYVTKLKSPAGEKTGPSWDEVREHVLELARMENPDRCVSLAGSEDDYWLVVYFVPDHGFHISGLGVGDVEHRTVIDEQRGQDLVEVWMAGDQIGYWRSCFVSRETMLLAVKEFYDSGCRAATVAWELAESVMSWD